VQERAYSLIQEVLRPLIQADGGDIALLRTEGDKIWIRLSGMCLGCPGQPYTLARVVEPLLKRHLGEHIVVIADHER
jgi:NifU-like protein